MLAKYWRKILMFILIVACLFNVVVKLVKRTTLKQELETSAKYTYEQQNKNN